MDYEEYRVFLQGEARPLWGEGRANALSEAIERMARALAEIEASPLSAEDPFFTDLFSLVAPVPEDAG